MTYMGTPTAGTTFSLRIVFEGACDECVSHDPGRRPARMCHKCMRELEEVISGFRNARIIYGGRVFNDGGDLQKIYKLKK